MYVTTSRGRFATVALSFDDHVKGEVAFAGPSSWLIRHPWLPEGESRNDWTSATSPLLTVTEDPEEGRSNVVVTVPLVAGPLGEGIVDSVHAAVMRWSRCRAPHVPHPPTRWSVSAAETTVAPAGMVPPSAHVPAATSNFKYAR
jgi:hypothetical protein